MQMKVAGARTAEHLQYDRVSRGSRNDDVSAEDTEDAERRGNGALSQRR
jgi:hypothetical protein